MSPPPERLPPGEGSACLDTHSNTAYEVHCGVSSLKSAIFYHLLQPYPDALLDSLETLFHRASPITQASWDIIINTFARETALIKKARRAKGASNS